MRALVTEQMSFPWVLGTSGKERKAGSPQFQGTLLHRRGNGPSESPVTCGQSVGASKELGAGVYVHVDLCAHMRICVHTYACGQVLDDAK